MISEDAADLALEGYGATSELGAEFGGERPQALVADLEADFGDGTIGGEHLTGTVHAQASQEIMRGLAEGGTEKAMEMKFGETGLSRRLLEQNTGVVFGGDEVASAAEAAEGVVMEKRGHEEMVLKV